jgi:hypothetical protein
MMLSKDTTQAHHGGLPKRKVSFNERMKVRRHVHINDFSDDEKEASWWTSDEVNHIKANIRSTIKLLEAGIFSEDHHLDEGLSLRGLEAVTPEGAVLKRCNKEQAWDNVLDEQDFQLQQGEAYNEHRIYNAYKDISRRCHEAARLMAQRDQYEVMGVLFPSKKKSNRPSYHRQVSLTGTDEDSRRQFSSSAA